jgi:hypothetical protein
MVAEKWTPKEEKLLKKYWYNTPKEDLLQKIPNRSWEGISRRAQRLSLRRDHLFSSLIKKQGGGFMPQKKTKDVLKIEQLVQQVGFYKKEYDVLVKERADTNNLIEKMKRVLSVIEPKGIYIPKPTAGKQEEEEMILLFSDSQIGTKSLGKEIGMTKKKVYGDIGEYNLNVFRYRLQLWLRSVIKIVKLHRKSVPVNKLNLWFLGDILENEFLFRGQGSYIETGLLQQFYASMYEIAQAIAVLASHFETIEIRGVAGNHGRGTPKPGQTKTWVNWEWLFYRYLELVCRDLTNVKFDLALSWYDLPEVLGHRFLMLHGEDIISYMRFPWYGAERMLDGYFQLLTAVGKPFEYMVFGHHHIAANFQMPAGEWFCNGAWTGYTQFVIKRLYKTEKPKQWLFFCHEKRGIGARYLLDLMEDDEKLWKKIKDTSYDIHIPPTNQAITAAMEQARVIRY